MRGLGVYGCANGRAAAHVPPVDVDGMAVRAAVVAARPPSFDAASESDAHRVLFRVSAFSCNYRDKGLLALTQRAPSDRYFLVGSELCGTVIETGAAVTTLRAGDRVIAQNHYTAHARAGVPEGIPTNQASREMQALSESQLCAIPNDIPEEAAAAFSLGAQTAYSMVRRVAPAPGATALVTAATSNTSLFLIARLKLAGARIVAATASVDASARLLARGADEVIVMPRTLSVSEVAERLTAASGGAGFAHVFDPFYDLHLAAAVRAMAPSASYITCGLAAQTDGSSVGRAAVRATVDDVMLPAMVKNLTLMGNCIGVAQDLTDAVADCASGRLSAVVDSVFTADAPAFLHRTFADRARFGKVVFRYVQ